MKNFILIVLMLTLCSGGSAMALDNRKSTVNVPVKLIQEPVSTFSLPSDFLRNASTAVQTAHSLKALLKPGKVWISKTPRGEVVIKAALMYEGVPVGSLEFDPITGEILPKGYHPSTFNQKIPLEKVKHKVQEIIPKLSVLNGAEFRMPESCWVVPLAIDGKIVSHVKIFYDGKHVVPDYPLENELK